MDATYVDTFYKVNNSFNDEGGWDVIKERNIIEYAEFVACFLYQGGYDISWSAFENCYDN